jgi:hypothetical protein
MNFGWMVGEIDTPLAFWVLGVGTPLVGTALIWRLVARRTPVQDDRRISDAASRQRLLQ